MVKKIAVFGGTGMTGQSVVEYALNQGEQKYIKSMNFFSVWEKFFCCLLSFHKNETKKKRKMSSSDDGLLRVRILSLRHRDFTFFHFKVSA